MSARATALGLILLLALSGCIGQFQTAVTGQVQPEHLLRPTPYPQWVVEIDYVSDHPPNQGALDTLESTLRSISQKSDIRIVVDDSLSESRSVWTDSDLRNMRERYQDFPTGGDRVTTYVLYVDGEAARGSGVLGVAYGSNQIVIFDETIHENAGNLFQYSRQDVETAVLIHEFGHVVGLVNNGIEMVRNHEDPDNPRHSSNRDSVMYWAIETTDAFSGLFGSDLPTSFDANDMADICQAGGRCAQ